jgi:hypothetical protein
VARVEPTASGIDMRIPAAVRSFNYCATDCTAASSNAAWACYYAAAGGFAMRIFTTVWSFDNCAARSAFTRCHTIWARCRAAADSFAMSILTAVWSFDDCGTRSAFSRCHAIWPHCRTLLSRLAVRYCCPVGAVINLARSTSATCNHSFTAGRDSVLRSCTAFIGRYTARTSRIARSGVVAGGLGKAAIGR